MTHYSTKQKTAFALWAILFFSMIIVVPALEGFISFGRLVLIFLAVLGILAVSQPHIHILNDEEEDA